MLADRKAAVKEVTVDEKSLPMHKTNCAQYNLKNWDVYHKITFFSHETEDRDPLCNHHLFPPVPGGSFLSQPAAWRQTRTRFEGGALCSTCSLLAPSEHLNITWLALSVLKQSFQVRFKERNIYILIWFRLWLLEELVIMVNNPT